MSRPNFRHRLPAIAAAGFSVFLAARAHAALLVYEPFSYPLTGQVDRDADGTDIHGLNGGVGFSGAWSEPKLFDDAGAPIVNSAFDDVRANATTHPMLGMEGGEALLHYTSIEGGETYLTRPFQGAVSLDPSVPRTLWMSALMWSSHTPATTAQGARINFSITLSNAPFDQSTSFVGFGDLSAPNYGVFAARLDQLQETAGSVPVTGNKLELLVFRMTFGPGGDSFDLFMNPTPGVVPTGAPDVSVTGIDVEALNHLHIRTRGALSSRRWTLDEIRIGDTYDDVAPVPEPASSALLLLAAAGFAARRRR